MRKQVTLWLAESISNALETDKMIVDPPSRSVGLWADANSKTTRQHAIPTESSMPRRFVCVGRPLDTDGRRRKRCVKRRRKRVTWSEEEASSRCFIGTFYCFYNTNPSLPVEHRVSGTVKLPYRRSVPPRQTGRNPSWTR